MTATIEITKEDKIIYAAIRTVADMMYGYASPNTHRIDPQPWLEDRRDESVNPYYNQTQSGLMLAMYYGQPGSIYTPWGEWNCWGSGSGDWDNFIPNIIDRLGLVIHTEEWHDKAGNFGPYYSITKVMDLVLPPCIIRDNNHPEQVMQFGSNHDTYIPYAESHKIWEALTNDWRDKE